MTLGKPTDARIQNASIHWESNRYRTPIKFGGRVVTEARVLNAKVTLLGRDGRSAEGFGSMPLGNTWAFPSAMLDGAATRAAMEALAERCAAACRSFGEFGHPIDLGCALEERFLEEGRAVSRELGLAEPLPKLAVLVTASPFDAALHDGFGKLHGRNCYHTYGPDFLRGDLGAYLGPDYRGLQLQQFIRTEPVPRLPLYHLVGALDPLTPADVARPIGDGLPETLPDWIDFNGLTHLKIKLNGDDSAWDLERIMAVDRIAAGKPRAWRYSLDFNERCPNVDYLVDLLRRLRECAPEGFERIQYIEQPTARDLKAHPENRMHEAAKLRPVVIDESLTDLESLLLARDMGYTGAALKACKGQTQSLLLAAAAQKLGMFLCVQDLTCPGASLIHSAGLAAHVPGVAGIECNSRQYCPAANRGWEDLFPGIFKVRDGTMQTAVLRGPGLGAVA